MKRSERRRQKQQATVATKRVAELEAAMERLIRDHPAVQTVNDWFLFITLYVEGANSTENQFCKNYLRRRAYDGYKIYDDERL